MKNSLYVIITDDIHPIGGMQLYTAGKAKFLEDSDWIVKVVYPGLANGKCAVSYLDKYCKGGFPFIDYNPASLDKYSLKVAIKQLNKYLNPNLLKYERVLIESQSDVTALWGELIAKELNGNHFCFNCNELFRGKLKKYEENIDFFSFKYDRKEIAGLRPDTLKRLFEGYRDIPISEEFMFDAVELYPIQRIANHNIEIIEKQDYNILYLGRANKGYVPNILKGVEDFSRKYKNKKVQLIIVGNPECRRNEIDELKSINNLSVVLLGDLFPIPEIIYSKVDVVIAGAVCAEISARMKVPTIVADCENYLANGVLGYTVNNSMYFDPEVGQCSFDEALEDVLLYRKYLLNDYTFPKAISPDTIYKSQFSFFDNATQIKEYYDTTSNVKTRKLGLKGFAYVNFPSIAYKLRKIKKSIINLGEKND